MAYRIPYKKWREFFSKEIKRVAKAKAGSAPTKKYYRRGFFDALNSVDDMLFLLWEVASRNEGFNDRFVSSDVMIHFEEGDDSDNTRINRELEENNK